MGLFGGGPDRVVGRGTQGWGRIVAIRVRESSDDSSSRIDEYVLALAPSGRRVALRQRLDPDDRVRLGMDVATFERDDEVVIDWERTMHAAGVAGSTQTYGWKTVKDWGGIGILDESEGRGKATAKGVAAMARIERFEHRSHLGGLATSLAIGVTVAMPGDEPFAVELPRQTVPFYASHLAVTGLQLRCWVDAKRLDRVTLDWAEAAQRHPGIGLPPSPEASPPAPAVSALAAPSSAAPSFGAPSFGAAAGPPPTGAPPAGAAAPPPIEGVSWQTYLAVTRSIQDAGLKPKHWDAHAQQFGVPAGRWARISQAWAMQMLRSAALQQAYAEAMR